MIPNDIHIFIFIFAGAVGALNSEMRIVEYLIGDMLVKIKLRFSYVKLY